MTYEDHEATLGNTEEALELARLLHPNGPIHLVFNCFQMARSQPVVFR